MYNHGCPKCAPRSRGIYLSGSRRSCSKTYIAGVLTNHSVLTLQFAAAFQTYTMSCLPLFSFSPSLTSALKPGEDSSNSRSNAQCPATPSMTSRVTHASEDLYDKLSQVSVSHRRVDSFEWIMNQSAPNTPPASHETSFEPFSPPPQRLATSAPLPVPGELWSTGPQRNFRKPQRGYFNWWSSPSLKNGTGYTMIPDEEEHEDRHAFPRRKSIAGPSRSHTVEARTSTWSCARASSTCGDRNQLESSQKLNALGIVLPDTPPPSPPDSKVSSTAESFLAYQILSGTSSPRRPKRVTFSPVIDEVTLGAFPDFKEQRSAPWGSYLPSSFLVAQPSLPRTCSMPVTQAKTAIRPILRRSTSSDPQFSRNTEMAHILSKKEEPTPVVISSLPAQRPAVSHSPVVGHASRDTDEADKAFALLLRATHKPVRRRCDSLLSIASSS